MNLRAILLASACLAAAWPAPRASAQQPADPRNDHGAAVAGQIELQEHIRWRAGLPDRRVYYRDPPALRRGAPLIWWDDDGLFEPWPVRPGDILGYRYDNPIEQPAGYDLTWTGPNAYVYGPAYDSSPVVPPPEFGPAPARLRERPLRDEVRLLDDVGEADRGLDLAEEFFRAGRYVETLEELDAFPAHVAAHGRAELLRSQALFALGEYVDAVAALRRAARRLPPEHWGFFVENYGNFYERPQQYTKQIRRLEEAVDIDAAAADLRLLLGYHYGYLHYSAEAVAELDEALRLSPRDALAAQLRKQFARQIPPAAALPPEGLPAAEAADDGPREF